MPNFAPELENLDGIGEDFKSFYEEKDGKFLLKSSDPLIAAVAKTVNGLDGALKNSRKEAEGYKKRAGDLKVFAEYGDNLDDIFKNVTEKFGQLNEQLKSKKDVNVDELKKGIRESMQGEITKREETITNYRKALHKHLVEGAAVSALAKFEGSVKLALPHVLNHLKVVEENGNFEVHVVKEDGSQIFSGDNPGEPMGVEEFVKSMSKSDEYGPLFKSQAKNGGGADPSRQTHRGTSQGQQLSPTQKISAGLAKMA